MSRYGVMPKDCGLINIPANPEFTFVLYMPIKMPRGAMAIPDALMWTNAIVGNCLYGNDDYVYLTVKTGYPQGMNRPGWHSDGFMTDDLNFVWWNHSPTEFCVQPFSLTQDHLISMDEMSNQARECNIVTYSDRHLIQMDQYSIHRVGPVVSPEPRTFVKVSVSDQKYNLKGNAHNYLLDYDWVMHDRGLLRNHPTKEPDQ